MDSPQLQYVIESKFPTPVAAAFAEMRRHEDVARDTQHPAAVLEALLHYLGSVVVCDVAARVPPEHVAAAAFWKFVSEKDGLDRFRRPVSAGSWNRLLHQGLGTLSAAQTQPVQPGLCGWFEQEAQRLETAIQARNRIHGGGADYSELKRHVVQLLASFAEISNGAYLMSVDAMRLSEGTRRAEVRVFEGAQPSPSTLELSEEVETGRVYLGVPSAGHLLCLAPFYASSGCPACRTPHLFRLGSLEPNGCGSYVAATSGHHATLLPPVGVPPGDGVFVGRYYKLERLELPWSAVLTTDAMALQPGEVVAGRYVTEELIGAGGMGQVYVARDQRSGSHVALKVLPFYMLSDRSLLMRFRAEAKRAAELSHPNIARLLDHGEAGHHHYLVIELATGWSQLPGSRATDLSQLRKPTDAARAVQIASQVCSALEYLHAVGVVHRDIKPQNLLLFDDGIAKVTDFGIARSRESVTLTMTGQVLGTAEYMSPEQADGAPDLDGRADLYSLGVVLFELLTGRVPFRAATPFATALKHKDPNQRAPSLLGRAPAGLARIVQRALEKDRNERFQSASEFLQALELGDVASATAPQPSGLPTPLVARPESPESETWDETPLPKEFDETPRQAGQRREFSFAQRVLRWLAFLPLGFLLIALAQLGAAIAIESLPTWFALGLLLPMTPFIAGASAVPCSMAPDSKVAATILVTLFAVFELAALIGAGARHSPALAQLARLWVDGAIVAGAVWAARSKNRQSL